MTDARLTWLRKVAIFAADPNWQSEHSVESAFEMTIAALLLECIKEIERLQKQVCGTCGGTGGVDSGGVTPWGAGIEIVCPSCGNKKETDRMTLKESSQFEEILHKPSLSLSDRNLLRKLLADHYRLISTVANAGQNYRREKPPASYSMPDLTDGNVKTL